MSGALPNPFTPPESDLRGFPWFELHVSRFVDSDFMALSTGDECKARIMLLCKSWQQVPAASLPNDDRILARLAGVSLSDWAQLREMALRGFVECSDGRLYHPVLAEVALRAFDRANKHRLKQETDAERKRRWRLSKCAGDATDTSRVTREGQNADGTRTERVKTGRVKGTGRRKNPPYDPRLRGDDADDDDLPDFGSAPQGEFQEPPKSSETPRITAQELELQIWAQWPKRGRERTTRAKVRAALAMRKEPPPAILAAVGAYLRSKDATKDGGDFVPGLHVWLREKLDAWIELSADVPASPSASAAVHALPDWFLEIGERMTAAGHGPLWLGYVRSCEIVSRDPLILRAASGYASEKLQREVELIERAAGRPVKILPPERTSQRGA